MLQNHILQVLALVAMEPPSKMNARELRREKTKVLAATRLGTNLILGQYDGYRNEEGVDPNSGTPTISLVLFSLITGVGREYLLTS